MPDGTPSIVRTALCTIAFSSSLAAGASGALARPAAHAAPAIKSAADHRGDDKRPATLGHELPVL